MATSVIDTTTTKMASLAMNESTAIKAASLAINARTATKASMVETLPTELYWIIFRNMSSCRDLYNLLLASPQIWRSFVFTDLSEFITRILQSEIPAVIIRDVVFASKSFYYSSRSRSERTQFLDHYFATNRSNTTNRLRATDESDDTGGSDGIDNWTIQEAARISQCYDNCSFFSQSYLEVAASTSVATFRLEKQGQSILPTDSETIRVKRAFLRFEIFSSLFRSVQGDGEFSWVSEYIMWGSDRLDLFLAKYAPWENEQLACVWDFLHRTITPAYDEVALHDMTYSDTRVTIISDLNASEGAQPHDIYREHVISKGMMFLRKLVQAKTWQTRITLLGGWPHFDKHFFSEVIGERGEIDPEENYDSDDPDNLMDDGSPTSQNFPVWRGKSRIKDLASGAKEAWFWANGPWHWLYRWDSIDWWGQDKFYDFRSAGHVFWDLERLNSWGVLEKETTPINDCDCLRGQRRIAENEVGDPEGERTIGYARFMLPWQRSLTIEEVKHSVSERRRLYPLHKGGWWIDGKGVLDVSYPNEERPLKGARPRWQKPLPMEWHQRAP